MNRYQLALWSDLSALVQSNEAFFFADQCIGDKTFRIFNYRLASYTDFLLPSAIECCGVTFEIDQFEQPVRLASLTPNKFFNLNENPMTMNLDLTTVVEIADKADGSLISTFTITINNDLHVKSKGSLASDQAVAASNWLQTQPAYVAELLMLESLGYTVFAEWVSPDNRIVLNYNHPRLIVLGIRSRWDGSYLEFDHIDPSIFPEVVDHWTKIVTVPDPVTFVANIPQMLDHIEGYVIRLASGQRVKIKTDWYLTLHRSKDSINSDRRLYEAVLAESTDDLRSLFHDDAFVIQRIEQMELFVERIYNHLVASVEKFYADNKQLDRKTYAIKAKGELDSHAFGFAMMWYVGKPVDYKGYMVKNWKKFGVTDERGSDDKDDTDE